MLHSLTVISNIFSLNIFCICFLTLILLYVLKSSCLFYLISLERYSCLINDNIYLYTIVSSHSDIKTIFFFFDPWCFTVVQKTFSWMKHNSFCEMFMCSLVICKASWNKFLRTLQKSQWWNEIHPCRLWSRAIIYKADLEIDCNKIIVIVFIKRSSPPSHTTAKKSCKLLIQRKTNICR